MKITSSIWFELMIEQEISRKTRLPAFLSHDPFPNPKPRSAKLA